jgi:hypothetical protein
MPRTAYRPAVALFVRQPVPGRVKTRLASDLGDQAACDFYRAMVDDVISQITAGRVPVLLFHDQDDQAGLPPEWAAPAEHVVSQRGDTLGERMTAAFEFAFAAGYDRLMVVGSDIPGISTQTVRTAVEALDDCDVVIVPAVDGGYCLIGARNDSFNPALFRGIPWSTAKVLDMTSRVCTANSLSFTLLDPLQDIDTLEDLRVYCRNAAAHATATAAWLLKNGFQIFQT